VATVCAKCIFWTMTSIFWTTDGVICALGYNESV
jgi:hypothetical protein